MKKKTSFTILMAIFAVSGHIQNIQTNSAEQIDRRRFHKPAHFKT
jgi:hypothetical protein